MPPRNDLFSYGDGRGRVRIESCRTGTCLRSLGAQECLDPTRTAQIGHFQDHTVHGQVIGNSLHLWYRRNG
jgi:hypothetical protein